MSDSVKRFGGRRRRAVAMLVAAVAGVAVAALVGVALAKTFTLQIAKGAKVTNLAAMTSTHENIVVNSSGRSVYDLTGDSKHHPECTKANTCFKFWFPLKVSSASKLSKAPGVKGKLGVWHRGGFFQVLLAGHPLYTFVGDSQKHAANGEAIKSFGGTWHVIKPSSASKGTNTTTSTTSSTSTTPCLYPPCY
jgi:predicted lipoprotein with Yx(FWY)xxD motif